MPAPGYSGKSLSDKLGIKPGMRVAVVRGPADLPSWLAPLPASVRLVRSGRARVECMLLFVTARSELARGIRQTLERIADGGMCWICWPKKTSGLATDVTENVLREVVLPTGWVDVKVCAVSDTWSGLKFLRRRAR